MCYVSSLLINLRIGLLKKPVVSSSDKNALTLCKHFQRGQFLSRNRDAPGSITPFGTSTLKKSGHGKETPGLILSRGRHSTRAAPKHALHRGAIAAVNCASAPTFLTTGVQYYSVLRRYSYAICYIIVHDLAIF